MVNLFFWNFSPLNQMNQMNQVSQIRILRYSSPFIFNNLKLVCGKYLD
jgi:hypothetical protein